MLIANYFRGSAVNLTSLAGLAQAFPEKSFMAGLLSSIDLTTFVWLFVLAIGLAVLYRRRTQSIFLGFVVVPAVICARRPARSRSHSEVLRCPQVRRSSSASSRWSSSAARSPATSGSSATPGKTVTTEKVQKRDLEAIVSASGKIQARTTVNIAADTMGRVIELAVDEGQKVKKGQFLMQIDPRNQRTATEPHRGRPRRGAVAARTAPEHRSRRRART